jgi:transposase
MAFIKGKDRNKESVISLEGSIASDNPVRLLDAFVNKLELEKMGLQPVARQEGRPAFYPAIFLKLYLYGYLNRIRSSRRLELECQRNIEVRWLLEELAPNYHSIADFRKRYTKVLRFVFKCYVELLKDQELMNSGLVALDGTKIRAQNSKKNNYNQKKIDRHLKYIEARYATYLQELDVCDEAEDQSAQIVVKKEEVNQKLKSLSERKINYEHLQKELNLSSDGQVSVSDADSRALNQHHRIVEVSYNVQTVVDSSHCLIADFEAINRNDFDSLHHMASRAKEILGILDLSVLADKGYHSGNELQKCEASAINTYVPNREDEDSKGFVYNKETDSYSCPQNQTLTSNGTGYYRKKGNRRVTIKKYRTSACKTCPVRSSCTKQKKGGRQIERSEYQDAVDRNNKRVEQNKELYSRRQAIVEHPFGTIKRSWGYTYTLLKGLEKVNAEVALIYLAYNIRRSVSILGVEALITIIKEWKGPKYPSLCSFLIHFKAPVIKYIEKTKNCSTDNRVYKMAI